MNRGREPLNSPIGLIEPRGAPTGIILRHGRIVAEWGEPFEVDMTFSVSQDVSVAHCWPDGRRRPYR